MHSDVRGDHKQFPFNNEVILKDAKGLLKKKTILPRPENDRFIFVTTSGSYET